MDGTEICVGHPDTVALALQDGGRCQLQHPQPNPAALSSALGKGIQRIVLGGSSPSQKYSGEEMLLKAARAATSGSDGQQVSSQTRHSAEAALFYTGRAR